MAKAADLSKGDRVRWSTPQGRTTGEVVRIMTKPFSIKGTDLQASKDDPRVVVQSEKTGAQAGHKPSALTKLAGSARKKGAKPEAAKAAKKEDAEPKEAKAKVKAKGKGTKAKATEKKTTEKKAKAKKGKAKDGKPAAAKKKAGKKAAEKG